MRKSASSSMIGPYAPSPKSNKKPYSPRRSSMKRKSIDPLKPYKSRPNSGSDKKFRVPSPYLRSPRSLSPGSSSGDEEHKGPQFAYGQLKMPGTP